MPAKQGQPPPKPKPEELIADFKEKFEAFKDETKKTIDETSTTLEKIRQRDGELEARIDEQNEQHAKLIEKFVHDCSHRIDKKIEELRVEVMEGFDKMSKKLSEETGSSAGSEEQLAEVAELIEDIQDKLIDFEEKKRNNLIFYGVKGELKETSTGLIDKVISTNLIYDSFNIW